MNDELPEIFERVRPDAAPAELRPRVLSAVAAELKARRKPAWERALEWGVAACLALGIGLNAWQFQMQPRWQRALSPGAEPVQQAQRSPLGDEQLTDFVNKRLASQRPPLGAWTPISSDYEKAVREIAERPAG